MFLFPMNLSPDLEIPPALETNVNVEDVDICKYSMLSRCTPYVT